MAPKVVSVYMVSYCRLDTWPGGIPLSVCRSGFVDRRVGRGSPSLGRPR